MPSSTCFLPDDYLERKHNRHANVVCAALFLIVMMAIGSTLVMSQQALHTASLDHAVAEKAYTEAAERVVHVRLMQDEQRRMSRRARDAASMLEKIPRSAVLAEVTNALPPGVTIVAFDLDTVDAPPANDATGLPQVSLRITGTGDSEVQVSQFVNTLSRSKILKNVNLRGALPVIADVHQMADDGLARKFTVDMALDPNAPATIAAEPKVVTTAVELKPE